MMRLMPIKSSRFASLYSTSDNWVNDDPARSVQQNQPWRSPSDRPGLQPELKVKKIRPLAYLEVRTSQA
ncbi:unnamed protein product [Urochloa humidicola]